MGLDFVYMPTYTWFMAKNDTSYVASARVTPAQAQALKQLPPEISYGVLFRALLDYYFHDKELPHPVAAARTAFLHKPQQLIPASLVAAVAAAQSKTQSKVA